MRPSEMLPDHPAATRRESSSSARLHYLRHPVRITAGTPPPPSSSAALTKWRTHAQRCSRGHPRRPMQAQPCLCSRPAYTEAQGSPPAPVGAELTGSGTATSRQECYMHREPSLRQMCRAHRDPPASGLQHTLQTRSDLADRTPHRGSAPHAPRIRHLSGRRRSCREDLAGSLSISTRSPVDIW